MKKIWLKHYPPGVPASIPPVEESVVTLFLKACEEFENQTAFRSFGTKLSYGELRDMSFRLSAGLRNSGLKKGDRIVIQLPNILQYPVSLWASWLAGLTVVNMNPLYTSEEMLRQIKDSSAKAMILISSCGKKLEKIKNQTKLKTVIVTDPGDLLPFPKKQGMNCLFRYVKKSAFCPSDSLSFPKALGPKLKKPPEIPKSREDLLFIQYTGGTTGIPKGACLSQKNILSNLKQCELWITSSLKRGKERALAPLPLYHIFSAVVNGLVLFLYGAENILIADPRNLRALIKTMKKHPVTLGTGVSALFKALLTRPELKKTDFSRCRFFLTGGMALESSVRKQWKKTTGVPLIEGYGLTEASPAVCCNPIPKSSEKGANHQQSASRLRRNSIPTGFEEEANHQQSAFRPHCNPISKDPEEEEGIGFPLPSTDIRIVDSQGRDQAPGLEGELEVRGPQVMEGYYKQEEETKNVFSNGGWLKTGDVAVMDQRGFVKIKDRKKDLINVSGFNVFPNEVEEALSRHHEVKEVVAVGIPNETSGEAVKAFVVKTNPSLTENDLKDHCRHFLTPYKIPRKIEFIEQAPKNSLGKPLRRVFKT